MTFRRRLADWTVPPAVQSLIRTGLRRWAPQEDLSSNRRFENLHQGKRCFVIATGPSIRRQDLKLLSGELCIGVSNLFVHPDYALLSPRYHCLAPCHPPITEEAYVRWLSEIAGGIGDAELFAASTDKALVRKASGLKAGKVHYLHYDEAAYNDCPRADLTRPLPIPRSVTVSALYLALYLGCREIYLLGFDHDWLAHIGESRHCYDENKHALNREGYDEWSTFSMEKQLRQLLELWQQYRALKDIAEARGAKIINATDGGWLDVFPRTDYGSLF